jgi:CRISPR-associated endonuclease Cas3-HD
LYSKEAGLELGQAGNEFPVQYTLRPPTLLYSYCYETWVDHVRRVMEQAGAMRDANALGARKLEHMAGLHTGTIEGFVQLAAVLHDVGKLAEEWQEKAWQWETQQTGRLRSEAIAHTTKEPMEKGPTLPHHAVEGAFAAADFLVERVRDGAWPIGCAIARHHSARSKEAGAFVLLREASELLGRLGTFPITFRDGKDRLELKEFSRAIGAGFDDIRDSWPIYAYVARRLRLADQAGTAMGAREGGSR